jgi:hypothetical protein
VSRVWMGCSKTASLALGNFYGSVRSVGISFAETYCIRQGARLEPNRNSGMGPTRFAANLLRYAKAGAVDSQRGLLACHLKVRNP